MPGSGLKKEKLNLTRPAARPPCRRESPGAEKEKVPLHLKRDRGGTHCHPLRDGAELPSEARIRRQGGKRILEGAA